MELAFEIFSYSSRLILNFEVIGSDIPVNSLDKIESFPSESKVNLSLSARSLRSEIIFVFSLFGYVRFVYRAKLITNSFGDSLRVSPEKVKPINISFLLPSIPLIIPPVFLVILYPPRYTLVTSSNLSYLIAEAGLFLIFFISFFRVSWFLSCAMTEIPRSRRMIADVKIFIR